MIVLFLLIQISSAHWTSNECYQDLLSMTYEEIKALDEYGIPESELAEIIVIKDLYLPSLEVTDQ